MLKKNLSKSMSKYIDNIQVQVDNGGPAVG